MGWSPRLVKNGTPPWDEEKNEIDRSRVRIYIVTDPAGGKDRKASENAILVAAKDKLRTFILDGWVKKAPLEVMAEEFIRLWLKWLPERYTRETTGPALSLPGMIQPLAEKAGLVEPGQKLPCREISRWGADKIARIEPIFPAMKSGELVFCQRTIPSRLVSWDEATGEVRGIIPDALQAFAADPEESKFDVLDAAADLIGQTRKGKYICPKVGRTEPREKPEEKSVYDPRFDEDDNNGVFPFGVDNRGYRW